METFYHGTSANRLKSILESGLIPPKCRGRWCDDECEYRGDPHGNFDYKCSHLKRNFGFIYFTEVATDALDWAGRDGGDDVILAVEIRLADLEPDPIIAGAWRTRGPIPPERISIVDSGGV